MTVTPLPTAPYRCDCGQEWFTTQGITLDRSGKVTGYALPLRCTECGKEQAP